MKKFFPIFVLAFASSTAGAYSCEPLQRVSVLYEKSDLSIVGKVDKKLFELRPSSNRYQVTIESVGKGTIASDSIVIWTRRPARCGLDLTIGRTYVFFLEKRGEKYWSSISSSWIVGDRTKEHTDEYRNLSRDQDAK